MMKEIIKEWEIPLEKVGYVVTDNGSNMIKAFKIIQSEIRQDVDEVGSEDVGGCSSDSEIDKEMADFEEREAVHAVAFQQENMSRLSCFSHTLQLVVMTFNKDPSAKKLLSSAYNIVRNTNKSGRATEALLKVAGKKLVAHSVTRWSTAYLVVHRLLDVQEHLQQVLLDCKLDVLQPREWNALRVVDKLLSVFASFTDIAGGESYTTLSKIIPCIMELKYHLDVMMTVDDVSQVAGILLGEVNRRFSYIMDQTHADFRPVYMVATLLDPRYSKVHEHLGTTSYARRCCLAFLKDHPDSSSNDNAVVADQAESGDLSFELSDGGHISATGEPPSKRRRGSGSMPFVWQVLKNKAKEVPTTTKESYPRLAQMQLDNYLSSLGYHDELTDPISFWISQQTSYTVLAPFAVDLLSVPSSSAAIERVFSTAGESTMGKRNRLSHQHLEREVLLRKNQMYYLYD